MYLFRFSEKSLFPHHRISLLRNLSNTTTPTPRLFWEPIPVRKLRPETNREKWINTLNRLNQPTAHLSLAGGYIHQVLSEFMQKDADALGLKYLFGSIYTFENYVLVPALQERLRERGLSTEGDYVELRTRLDENSDIFKRTSDKTSPKNEQKEK